MLSVAISAVSKNTSVGKVGEANAKGHAGPNIDHHQRQNDGAVREVHPGHIPKQVAPVTAAVIADVKTAKHRTPKWLVTHNSDYPPKEGRLGRANVRIK